MDVADANHGGARSDRPFVVFAVPSATAVPSIGPFHDPAFFQRHETLRPLGAHLHFDPPRRPLLGHPLLERMVVILAVAEDRLQSRKLLRRNLREQQRRCGAVVQGGAGDQHRDQQSQRIDQQMPLPALDFLAAVVAPLFPADLGRLHRLAVDAGRTGGRFASRCDADLRPQRIDDPLPSAVIAPLGEIAEDRALGRQVVRQHVPLATAAIEVQNRVDNLPEINVPRTAEIVRALWRQQRRNQIPLVEGEIRGIRSAGDGLEPHGQALRG